MIDNNNKVYLLPNVSICCNKWLYSARKMENIKIKRCSLAGYETVYTDW